MAVFSLGRPPHSRGIIATAAHSRVEIRTAIFNQPYGFSIKCTIFRLMYFAPTWYVPMQFFFVRAISLSITHQDVELNHKLVNDLH